MEAVCSSATACKPRSASNSIT